MTHRPFLSPRFSTITILLTLSVVMLAASGCAQSRTITITTKPGDALIRVGGVERGRGRVVQKFDFSAPGQSHLVVASRPGFKDEEAFVTQDAPADDALNITLRPLTKRVTITVSPVPAYVSIDGKYVSADAVSLASPEVDLTLDSRGDWNGHTVTAERKGWQAASQRVTWTDKGNGQVDLKLEPLKKDLNIVTTPAGAQVFVDGQTLGPSPAHSTAFPFPVDPDTGEFVTHHLRITMPGFDDVDQTFGWDDGRSDYSVDLTAKSKSLRIVTNPAGAVVKVEGKELPRDPTGASVKSRLEFPPIDNLGNLKTYAASVSKPPGDQLWESKDFTIGWDGGQKEYKVELKEIRTRVVPLVRWHPERKGTDWRLVAETTSTTALKDVGEGSARRGTAAPFRVVETPKGWSIDSLSVSPDGTQIVYGMVSAGDGGALKAKVDLIGTDAGPGGMLATKPDAVELTPSFSPDGARVVFSSNRSGAGRFSAWSVAAAGNGADNGAPVRLTDDETSSDLWPSLDADPKPRVFCEALVGTRTEPRLCSARVGAAARTDLGEAGAAQPRVSPKGDSVIFTRADPKTGKRDVFQIPDEGGAPLNLTQTPDVDECDAVWSPDGGAIAVASDAGTDDEGRRNYDIWIIDMKNPERPRRVTTNGSQDDSPGWSPLGDAIYFRSNRGGSWGIWKVELK